MATANQSQMKSDLLTARKELIEIEKKMIEARDIYFSIRKKYDEAEKIYNLLDRQLAMIDGRYKVIETKKGGGVKQVKQKLTKQQMAEVLASL